MKLIYAMAGVVLSVLMTGCGQGGFAGYQNEWLHPQDMSSVYVEMFDAGGFRRGHEFKLTEAVCKRIEAQTPYKIVTDRSLADSILSGTTPDRASSPATATQPTAGTGSTGGGPRDVKNLRPGTSCWTTRPSMPRQAFPSRWGRRLTLPRMPH